MRYATELDLRKDSDEEFWVRWRIISDENDTLKGADQWFFDLHKILGAMIEGGSMLIKVEVDVWWDDQSCKMSVLLHRANLWNQILPEEKRVNRDKF